MDPSTTAAIALLGAGNPGALIGGILVILILAVPLFIKFMTWNKEQSAQGTLYAQLSEQLQQQRIELKEQRLELDKVMYQRGDLLEQVAQLKGRIEQLEDYETDIKVLKDKLDDKDKLIAERDDRISTLLQELITMKDRVHNLELRLKDSNKYCLECKQNLLDSSALIGGKNIS